jgi:hypothetical protein
LLDAAITFTTFQAIRIYITMKHIKTLAKKKIIAAI